MAYIDILSSNTANVAHLDITDFGLATASDVSNIVVLLNVYNTATANSWDNEAYLINNGEAITSNYASNVLHSNTITYERVFVFNANTFSKLEIESQSFGFRYKPQSDGSVRVYVGNVRVRINNSQPANGITSYVQHRVFTENIQSTIIRNNDISLIKRLSVGIASTARKAISSTKTIVTGITSSFLSNVILDVQEILLTCSVGLKNTQTKSISLIKLISSKISASIVKNIQSIRLLIAHTESVITKNIFAIRNAIVSTTPSLRKSVHKNILVNVQSVIELLQSKLMKLILTIQIGLEPGLTNTINKTINGFVSFQSNVEKIITKILSTHAGISSTIAIIADVIQNIIVPVSRMMLVKARDLYEMISKRESVHRIKKRDNTENI